jgi:hypothetical protein
MVPPRKPEDRSKDGVGTCHQWDEVFTTRPAPSADPPFHRSLARPRPPHDVFRGPASGSDLTSQRVSNLARIALVRFLCIFGEGQLIAPRVQLIALLCPHNTICPRYSYDEIATQSEPSRSV